MSRYVTGDWLTSLSTGARTHFPITFFVRVFSTLFPASVSPIFCKTDRCREDNVNRKLKADQSKRWLYFSQSKAQTVWTFTGYLPSLEHSQVQAASCSRPASCLDRVKDRYWSKLPPPQPPPPPPSPAASCFRPAVLLWYSERRTLD